MSISQKKMGCKSKYKRLTEEEIETLVAVVKESLLATSKLDNIDRSIG